MPTHSPLLGLSDELLLLVLQELDRYEVASFSLTSRKLRAMSLEFLYREHVLSLAEKPHMQIVDKMGLVPQQSFLHLKHLIILNQNRIPGAYFYNDIVPQEGSHRIMRWRLLDEATREMEKIVKQSSFFLGHLRWHTLRFTHQLSTFRWRHSVPLPLSALRKLLLRNISALTTLEISMIDPPSARACEKLHSSLQHTNLHLRSLRYDGLSHTEPIEANRPTKGGRFRMLRPIFKRTHQSLDELVLSQDHCISQIGKTPLINGRTFHAFLCNLDELYVDPHKPHDGSDAPITLNLSKLELGGFDINSLFTTLPRLHFELPGLRRLVLNDCYGVKTVLETLAKRKDEIHLSEFGLRVREDDTWQEHFDRIEDALKIFLTSFTGLEVLSVLWDGPGSPNPQNFMPAVQHHHKTLRACSLVSQNDDFSDDEDNSLLRFVKMPYPSESSLPLLRKPPQLQEFALALTKDRWVNNYLGVRALSQFDQLRTIHIRNFPPLDGASFWRDEEGSVTKEAHSMAESLAEQAALPFYALPHGSVDENLQSIADMHTTKRDKELLGGVKFKSVYSTSIPTPDLTRKILEQRADIDFGFANIMHKKTNAIDTLTQVESDHYVDYERRVRIALGLEPPENDVNRPKLSLLIVGDWRYRDVMNLAGPRTYDPSAWSTVYGRDYEIMLGSSSMEDVGDNEEDDDDDDDDDQDGTISDGHRDVQHGSFRYRLRRGFKNEFDVCLLPIFFRIHWNTVQSADDLKWRWKATAVKMDQSTLEGFTKLDNVRTLDFWF